jgi:hypothetical protein
MLVLTLGDLRPAGKIGMPKLIMSLLLDSIDKSRGRAYAYDPNEGLHYNQKNVRI